MDLLFLRTMTVIFFIHFCLIAIGNAFAILTDPEKRKQYDLYGAEAANTSHHRSSASHYEYNYTRGFESNFKK